VSRKRNPSSVDRSSAAAETLPIVLFLTVRAHALEVAPGRHPGLRVVLPHVRDVTVVVRRLVGELPHEVAEPFVASGPSGVAFRARLKRLTPGDEKVLRLVGAHLGALASKDIKTRCRDGLEHSADTWAARTRELSPVSSSRWAGEITKASHDQWSPARRCRLTHIQNLEAGIRLTPQAA